MIDFAEWLNDELQKRGWKQADLARQAGISREAVSTTLSCKRRAGFQVCSGIAHAFGMPVMDVFRLAGLAPPVPVETPIMKEFRELFAGLPPDEQKKALRFLRCFAEASKADKEINK